MSHKKERRVCLFVTIINHGHTDISRQSPRVMQGQSDHPMNSLGTQQANALGWRLRNYLIDCIYTSDLIRAKQTATEIAKHHPGAPVIEDNRLREMARRSLALLNLGDLTGMLWPQVKEMLKKEDKHLDDITGRRGETHAQFKARVINLYGALISRHLVEPHDKVMASMSSMSLQSIAQPAPLSLKSDSRSVSKEHITATVPLIPGQIPEPSPASQSLKYKTTGAVDNSLNKSLSQSMRNMSLGPTAPTASTSSISNPVQLPVSLKRQLQFKQRHILLVSHGGWIEQLMRHLIDDLKFQVHNNTQHHPGFPKSASVYQFMISKNYKADGDYEWAGTIPLMNCVGHLASLNRNSAVATVKPSSNYVVASTTAKAKAAAAAACLSPSPSRKNMLKGPNAAATSSAATTPRVSAHPAKKIPEPPSVPRNAPNAPRSRTITTGATW
eukprot:jgi/Hompol1/4562/HPOL_003703-RA